ncbi:MAG: hypothetical protein K0R63_779 [Rickettsiales bacterium]|nr:hypothetical protein [Rickettsiales bacterium]
MQVDAPHKELYAQKAPELLEALDTGEADIIMKRDPKTGFCVKFSNGLCGIHQEYGEAFLGDACNFYPRATRQLGDNNALMGATLSCPEITRLALFGNDPFSIRKVDIPRVPHSIADYMPEVLSSEQSLEIIQAFLKAAEDTSATPEHIMLRLISISKSLEYMKPEQWPEAVPFYLRTADARLIPGETQQSDPYRLFQNLCALIAAAKIVGRPRLQETVDTIERALNVTMDWKSLEIRNNASDLSAYDTLKQRWESTAATACASILRRYIQSQLALAMFPFSGFGNTLSERAMIMAIRFATVRLALMAHVTPDGTLPDQAAIVQIIQSISRLLDHLADPTLSLTLYRDAGWLKESRMRGVLER